MDMNVSCFILLFAIAIDGVCGAGDSSNSAPTASQRRRRSQIISAFFDMKLLQMQLVSALHVDVGRKLIAAGYQLFSKSSKKADGKSGKSDSSTKSDKANKSAKAYSKEKDSDDSTLCSHHVLMFKQNSMHIKRCYYSSLVIRTNG